LLVVVVVVNGSRVRREIQHEDQKGEGASEREISSLSHEFVLHCLDEKKGRGITLVLSNLESGAWNYYEFVFKICLIYNFKSK
jgi:hypothetical protein